MNQLFFKKAPAMSIGQIVGASPWTYTNSSGGIQLMTISNGALVTIEMNTGLGFVLQVPIAGVFTLFPTQQIRVNYVITAPTVTMTQL